MLLAGAGCWWSDPTWNDRDPDTDPTDGTSGKDNTANPPGGPTRYCIWRCPSLFAAADLTSFLSVGQSSQQVVTQLIRGQAVSTAVSGASPVATVTGQGAASPTVAGQTPSGTALVQGQVKLKHALLARLTPPKQLARLTCPPPPEGRLRRGSARWGPAGSHCDGPGSGSGHGAAAGHSSRGHRHPRSRPAAHAGVVTQRPGAALPLHAPGLSCHAHIEYRYDNTKRADGFDGEWGRGILNVFFNQELDTVDSGS